MNINIDHEIDYITAQIIEKYEPEKIILFGSAANGDIGPDSDIDFLIVKRDTPYKGAERIRELSRLIDRSVAVDFLVYRTDEYEKRLSMGDPFLKTIVKEGKTLYG
jgi:predicted nucleotidyltransferase